MIAMENKSQFYSYHDDLTTLVDFFAFCFFSRKSKYSDMVMCVDRLLPCVLLISFSSSTLSATATTRLELQV